MGTFDFNDPEVLPFKDKLGQAGYHTWLRIFEGSHQWAPAEVIDEVFAWFRIEGMQSRLEPVDQSVVGLQFADAVKRVDSLEQARDVLDARREYVQIVENAASVLPG
jgi:hypothetical protein